MNNRLQSNGHSHERRLIESDAFPFEFISQLAEMESWRKEVYRPIYHIHKWWAKRLGSVFRGILLGSALPDSENLVEAFYRQHDFAGLTVFDPFMGSGTTIGEAHKLGFTALGRDINPVACESVRVSLGPLDRDALMKAFGQLSAGVGERIRALYQTADAEGHVCDALYFFGSRRFPVRLARPTWICSRPTFSFVTPISSASQRSAWSARNALGFSPQMSTTRKAAVLIADTSLICTPGRQAARPRLARTAATSFPSPRPRKLPVIRQRTGCSPSLFSIVQGKSSIVPSLAKMNWPTSDVQRNCVRANSRCRRWN